ncbi:MAG: HEAT repeat domain-containing protein [Chloroflexi bacterium]|nr:HEAT repeat domain-containing protein [Chloroflexota bacterium]MBP8059547.1 HEAT repeat domain-containing protein [Chloroflexota bacterium]
MSDNTASFKTRILQLIATFAGLGHDAERNILAVQELKVLGADTVFPVLTELFDDPDPGLDIPANAITAVLAIDSVRGFDLVLPFLQNFDSPFCYHVCGLMSEFGDHRAIAPLLHVLKHHPNPQDRGAAAFGLQGPGEVSAIPSLYGTEQNDFELDILGHTPAHSACGAISEILEKQVLEHITQHTDLIINRVFDNDSQLIGQITCMANPTDGSSAWYSPSNPFLNLPHSYSKRYATQLISLHPFPLAVETAFIHPDCEVKRGFYFTDSGMAVTVFEQLTAT